MGLDVGGTNVRSAVGLGEEPRAVGSTRLPHDYATFLAVLQAMIEDASGDRPLEGVGIGIPGVILENMATWVPNVPFVVGAPLADDLGARVGAPVYLANDAQVALLGEARYGAAREHRSVALFSIGTGVGGAILVGDRVLRGAHGAAGSFGWVNVDFAGQHHPDHGQLELLASGRALDAAAREGGVFEDGPGLVAAARGRDGVAVRRLSERGRLLGTAIATVASTLDPELVLISGGVSEAFDLLEPAVREAISALASPTARSIPVRVASLGSLAGAWGAVALAAEGEEAFVL